MDLAKYRHADSVRIAASPAAVYAIVSDITRTGEFSPVCTGGAWDDDSRTTFTGSNANGDMKWDTKCRVDAARPGEEFTFTNLGFQGDLELVRWSYVLAPDGDGTLLTESWEVLEPYEAFISQLVPDAEAYLDGVIEPTRTGIATTLAAIKASAEA